MSNHPRLRRDAAGNVPTWLLEFVNGQYQVRNQYDQRLKRLGPNPPNDRELRKAIFLLRKDRPNV